MAPVAELRRSKRLQRVKAACDGATTMFNHRKRARRAAADTAEELMPHRKGGGTEGDERDEDRVCDDALFEAAARTAEVSTAEEERSGGGEAAGAKDHAESSPKSTGIADDAKEDCRPCVVYLDDRSRMTEDLWKKYNQQVEASEGFDVDYFPNSEQDCLLGSMYLPNEDEDVIEAAQRGIDFYNRKKKDGPIEFVRITNCVSRVDVWIPFYITLQCLDSADNQVKTYQTLVHIVPPLGYACRMFRLKPPENAWREKIKGHPLYRCCRRCREDGKTESDVDEDFTSEGEEPIIDEELDEKRSEDAEDEDDSHGSNDRDEDDGSYDTEDDDESSNSQDAEHSSGDNRDEDDSSCDAQDCDESSNSQDEDDNCGEYQDDDSGDRPNDNLECGGKNGSLEFTLDHLETYYDQVEESQGFDVDYFPGMDNLCFITPVPPPWDDQIAKHADYAVEFLNKEGAQFHLARIVKINLQTTYCCSHIYITFEAKNGDNGECDTYQARILSIPGRENVEEVRLKSFKS